MGLRLSCFKIGAETAKKSAQVQQQPLPHEGSGLDEHTWKLWNEVGKYRLDIPLDILSTLMAGPNSKPNHVIGMLTAVPFIPEVPDYEYADCITLSRLVKQDKRRSILTHVMAERRWDAVDVVLDSPNIDLNADHGGWTPTTLALEGGVPLLEKLKSKGWDGEDRVNKVLGATALYMALVKKDPECVEWLLNNTNVDFSVVSRYSGATSLALAAGIGSPHVAELLRRGAKVMVGRQSPVTAAVYHNRLCVVRCLLAERGFVRVLEWRGVSAGREGEDEGERKTALELARELGHEEMVGVLEDAMVDAKLWERRMTGTRIGLLAADTRRWKFEAKQQRGLVERMFEECNVDAGG